MSSDPAKCFSQIVQAFFMANYWKILFWLAGKFYFPIEPGSLVQVSKKKLLA
jgi:hypothetical protein